MVSAVLEEMLYISALMRVRNAEIFIRTSACQEIDD